MAGEIRFFMDEHVSPAATLGLRRRGVDVTTVQEIGMIGADDEALLRWANSQERVIFSQDEDFLALHRQGVPHAGIAYAHQQSPIGYILRGLVLIHDVLTSEEMRGRVEFL